MIAKGAWTAITTVAAIAGGTVAVESRYEKQADAVSQYEHLAGEAETERIRTQLQIIEIRLQRFKELATVRPLNDAEKIDLNSLMQEQAALLSRLAQKS